MIIIFYISRNFLCGVEKRKMLNISERIQNGNIANKMSFINKKVISDIIFQMLILFTKK